LPNSCTSRCFLKTAAAVLLLALPCPVQAVRLDEEVEALLGVIAVSGREEPAAELIRGRLAGLPVERDALGNVVVTLGSGKPRRLLSCSLGEPGFIVSGIREDGFLRVVPTGADRAGALWVQSHEGQTVLIGGSHGWTPGAVAVSSVHLQQGTGAVRAQPFTVDDLFVDVGAESAAGVAELGIRLLDPVALLRRPTRLAGDLIAGPAAALKGACIALADAARRLSAAPGQGTVVFAWTFHDLTSKAGLRHLVGERGPFEEVARAGDAAEDGGRLSLPARYPGTPVETISLREVKALSDTLLTIAGGKPGAEAPGPPLPPAPAVVEAGQGHEETAGLLGSLIARYGVSGAEGPVRDEVRRHLPGWAQPTVDGKGNLTATFGEGDEHVLFVAHMDEVGFRVAEVLPDGRLRLEVRGGLLRSVWEAQAALIHGERGAVPAVFEPREGWATAAAWAFPGDLTVYLGVSSAREAEALGVRVGSTVTMPKRMFRLGEHRVLARSFDDRVGSTALLLALRRIDPARLGRRVTFAWVVEEEVGLEGSKVLAERLTGLTAVHPVDTFVSSDSPVESRAFAATPLGQGVVLRGMDNGYLAPRELIDRFLALAEREGLPVQVGFTGGATDGMAFLANGPAMLPFSWPGRYSHSPVEVADLRDVESLVRLIVAVAGRAPAQPPLRP